MAHPTKYDIIVDFLFNYWVIAVLVVLAIVIGFIPSFRDGITELLSWLKYKKKIEEFIIITNGETITFETKTISSSFDVVKVNCLTHHLGVRAEYQWIEKHYPDFKMYQQSLKHIKIDKNEIKYYDVVKIKNEIGNEKSIYFDISSFFNQHGSSSVNRDKFIESKIRELHKTQ